MRYIVLALLVGIAACVKTPVYTAPVIPWDLSADSVAGKTVCSLNNRPLSLVDYAIWQSVNREFILKHESVHVQDAVMYKGGCWPFMYRYAEDKEFALQAEYKAYCIEGKFAVERNAHPKAVWERIQIALVKIDPVRALKLPNCIY